MFTYEEHYRIMSKREGRRSKRDGREQKTREGIGEKEVKVKEKERERPGNRR
jgi:hypothetical protein